MEDLFGVIEQGICKLNEHKKSLEKYITQNNT